LSRSHLQNDPAVVKRLDQRLLLTPQSHGYNSHEARWRMRSVNVAELKNRLSKYLTFAKDGEEIVIRDRNLPVAKLVPFSADDSAEEELLLVAAGKMRLPKHPVDLEKLLRVPTGRIVGREVTQALLDERVQSL
jgi:prevent-host-death family protein